MRQFKKYELGAFLLLFIGVVQAQATDKDAGSLLNIVTFIPQKAAMETHESPRSIKTLCQGLNTQPNTNLQMLVAPRGVMRQPVLAVSRVPAVSDDVIFVFVSGWAGWPGNVPYRYYGNAAYYAYLYQRAGIITGPCVCYDHPNQTIAKATFGQKPDQENLHTVLQLVREANPQASLVLVGFSYGATTILNFMSQQPAERLANIKAVVVESPFIDLQAVLAHALGRFMGKVGVKVSRLLVHLVSYCKQYKKDEPTIITRAHALPCHVPIMIGALDDDHVVNYKGVKRIVRTLKQQPGLMVDFFVDRDHHRRHSFMSTGVEYAKAVAMFLRKHGLPHCIQ